MADGGHDDLESRVLVLAPTARDALATRDILAGAGVASVVCPTVADVCREATRGAGAALVTAETVLADRDGQLAALLRGQPPWSDLPLIVLTPPGAESPKLLRELESLGSVTLMKRPVQVSTVVSTVRAALRDRKRQYAMREHLAERARRADEAARAQARLAESEGRLRTALAAARMVAWEWTPADGRLRVSENAADVFGLPAGVGLTGIDQGLALLHPDDLAAYRAAFQRAIDDRTGYLIRYRLVRPDDGRVIWIEEQGHTVFDRPGGGVRLYGVAMDVTARVRAEEELARVTAESDRRKRLYETILSATPDFVYVFSLDHRVLYANPALIRMWGHSPEDTVGKTFLEIGYEPWHAEMHGREIDQVRATRAPIRGEVPFTGTLGRRIYDYIFVPVLGPDGEVEAVAGTTRDVTDRKEMEERFRLMADAIPQIVWITDAAGRTEFFNRQWEAYTGAAAYPATAAGVAAEHVHPDDGPPTMAAFEEARRTGTTFQVEHRIRSAAGEYRWFLVRAEPLRDPATGEVVRWFGTSTDVHDARTAEGRERRLLAAAAEANAQFRALFEQATAGIARTDPTGRFTLVNPRYCEIVGYTEAELLGMRMQDLTHPDDLPANLEQFGRLAAGGPDFVVEKRYVRKDGSVVWVSNSVTAVRDAAGAIAAVVAVTLDVSDRKRAEAALRRSEERLALAQRAASVGTWDWDLATGTVVWSEGLYLLLDRTPEEITPSAEAWRDIVHPDDLPEVARLSEEAIRAGGEFYAEFRARRKDGSDVWVASKGRAYLAADGTPARFVGVNYDITQRKRAEGRLRASEERFRAFMDHSPAAAWITDADGRIRYLSATYTRLFRVPAADLVGKTGFDLYPEEFAREYVRNIRAVADGNRLIETVERAPRPDGSVGDFLVYKFPLPEGDEVRVGGVAIDITERLRAEEQLRDADRKKDDFIALLAHELRNPLAPIRNGLQVLRLSPDREARERAQGMMDRQLTHMVRLIDDLLDASRISRNKMELRRGRILLADAVGSAVETARPAIEAAGHDLRVDVPGEPIFLDADLTRVAQVIANLLTNSAKYTDRGGRIDLAARRDGGEAVVRVSDTGIGIPAESLGSIFDMFSQVDRTIERSTGGLGIGLALVKGLVEMHGGTVAAASDGPGRGSVFTVRLPAVPPHAAPPASGQPAGANGSAAGPGRRILVVDDNRDSAESMGEMLRLFGNEVALAHDGLEAVERAGAFRPQVILMDVGMPRLNGYEATRRIREEPWGRDIAIVALTGWGQDGDRTRSKAAGCDGHLVKPVSLPDLQRILGELG